MDVGVGLPNPVPDTPGPVLEEWARRAEARGFTSLATIDRIAYPSYESLVALAAAAAVTERITLLTNILLAPTRNPVLLAKEAASVDRLSGGRLVLGVAPGARADDYAATGQDFRTRGRRLDRILETLHEVWEGRVWGEWANPVGPRPVRGRVPILVGGDSLATARRVARWGIGWTRGEGDPKDAVVVMEQVREAWKEAGRDGSPRFVALTYFALGERAAEGAARYLTGYYGPVGSRIAERTPTTPRAVREAVGRYADYGFDELVFDPTVAHPDQVDLLADAVL